MKIKHPWVLKALPFLAHKIFVLFRATWRLHEDVLPQEIQDRIQKGLPVVYAHWHEDEWGMLGFYTRRKMTILVSMSQDGALMADFAKKFGFHVARGSSSRRGAGGFLQLLREVKKSPHGYVSMAIDGPRGPRRKTKHGVFQLAKILQAPIVSGAVYADRVWVFKKAWSRAFFPKPWAHLQLCYAKAMTLEELCAGLAAGKMEELSAELEKRIVKAKEMAAEKIAQQ